MNLQGALSILLTALSIVLILYGQIAPGAVGLFLGGSMSILAFLSMKE